MSQQTERLLQLLDDWFTTNKNSNIDTSLIDAFNTIKSCVYLEEVMHTSKYCYLKQHQIFKVINAIQSPEVIKLLNDMPFMSELKKDILNMHLPNIVVIDGILNEYQPNVTVALEL